MRLAFALPVLLLTSPLVAGTVDFFRDVRPILAGRCFECHGPQKQKNGLRLDAKAHALKGGEEHKPLFVPGKSAESVIIRFVSGADPDLRMPPKGEMLSAAEIATLKAWIDEGALWPDDGIVIDDPLKTHWAFQPLKSPAIPEARNTECGIRNGIDRFIAAKLAENGLRMSPEADARTLIRRLYLDLIGLPPTMEEVAAFVTNYDPTNPTDPTYQRLMDKLLGSPRHGERWARHWLDVVRFAETDGFEKNVERPNAWPYRDYVIRALNSDKPFDQFIRDQICGDLTGEDAAMGFIVGGPMDEVKSPDPVLTAQQRADELNDMVTTTGTAFLGLTLQCARCHNHKFDPVTQTDYYALAAAFSGVKHGERPLRDGDYEKRAWHAQKLRAELSPVERKLAMFEPLASTARTIVILPTDERRTLKLRTPNAKPTAYEKGAAKGEAEYAGSANDLPTIANGYWVWLRGSNLGDVFAWMPGAVGRFRVWVSWGSGYGSHDEDARYVLDRDGDIATKEDQIQIGQADHRKFADGSGTMPNRKLWSGFKDLGAHEFRSESKLLLRVGGESGFPTADVLVLQEETGAGRRLAPHLRVAVRRGVNVEHFPAMEAKFVKFTVLGTSQSQPCLDELEIFTCGPQPRNVALASAGAVPSASSTLPGFAIHQLKHLNDGLYGNDRSWISNEKAGSWAQIELAKVERIDRVVWSRDRDEVPRYNDRLPVKYRIETSIDGKSWKTVATHEDRLPFDPDSKKSISIISSDGLPAEEAREFAALQSRRRRLQEEIAAAEKTPMVYAGKLEKPAEIFRLNRGEVTQPREKVMPGVLASFGRDVALSEQSGDTERRRALAAWIADPANPLTTRVIVNRLWQWHFGEGLVSTPSDFGVNGGKPSHPELLDWLAAEFMRRGWSLKEMHRLICMSAVYRQAFASAQGEVLSAGETSGSATERFALNSDHQSLAAKIDGANRLLWRFPPRRLEAEPLRDSILAVSGTLDLRMGGPGFQLFEPNTNYVRVYTPKKEFLAADYRRMIYWQKPRMRLDDTFGVFDCPDAGQVQPKRTRSTTPLQALSLLNSPFLVQQAGFFAERVRKRVGGDADSQVIEAFAIAFQRKPAADERAAAVALVRREGLETLCRALLNANEFLYIH